MILNVTLVGDRALVASLDALPANVLKALEAKVQVLVVKLQQHVVTDKLHGQVLHQRSGQLARSIQTRIEATQMAVFGFVFSAGDVKYAKPHEFGFEGDVTVRQHQRTMVFGREVAPFSVGPYQRHMKIPEKSFLRSSLTDMQSTIETELREAALAAARQGVEG